jgi:hypothetical protein
MKITEKKFDIATGEETITERNATSAEIIEMEKATAEMQFKAAKIAESEAAKIAAQAKLAALGLTNDDLKALGL